MNRPTGALGNMKAHLFLDRDKGHWVSVGQDDLRAVLSYVAELERSEL